MCPNSKSTVDLCIRTTWTQVEWSCWLHILCKLSTVAYLWATLKSHLCQLCWASESVFQKISALSLSLMLQKQHSNLATESWELGRMYWSSWGSGIFYRTNKLLCWAQEHYCRDKHPHVYRLLCAMLRFYVQRSGQLEICSAYFDPYFTYLFLVAVSAMAHGEEN